MTQIHQEITVELERILTQGRRQEIIMLVFRLYMDDRNIPFKNHLSLMLATHVDMLRIRVRHGIMCQLYCTFVVLKNYVVSWLSSKTSMHGMPRVGRVGKVKHYTCLIKRASLAHSDMATYSASVVESVTHFCVLENQLTAAPPHITTAPDTDLRSVALLA